MLILKKKEEISVEEKNKQDKVTDNSNKVDNDESNKKKSESIFLYTIKIILGVIFLFPLIVIDVCLYISLAIIIYMIIKGIAIYGILLINIGFIFIFSNIYDNLYNIIFKNKKLVVFPFMVGIVLLTMGGLLTIDYVANIEFFDNLPGTIFESKKVAYNETFTGKLRVNSIDYGQISLEVNNELEDYEAIIEVTYYDDYVKLKKEKTYNDYHNITYIEFDKHNKKRFNDIITDWLENLKNKQIYDYSQLYNIKVKVYANEKMLPYIDID